jgi:hypothetical protein
MSSVNPTGTASTFSSALAALNATSTSGTPGGAAPTSLDQLQRTLYQQLDQAFKQGSSLSEIGTSLLQQVSATLEQYGVSDDQRQTVVNNLQQVFSQASNRSDARQNARQVIDNFFQTLQPSSTGDQTAPAGSPLPSQGIDLTA